jgi:uncharacterized protein
MRGLAGAVFIIVFFVVHASAQKHPSPELFDAVEHDRIEQVKSFLAQNVKINAIDQNNGTLIHRAVASRSMDSLKLLLSLGADVNLRNKEGRTPLMAASTPQLIELLLAAGADINAKDNEGKTALMGAAYSGEITVVKCLLRNKADPEIRTPDGKTALDLAIARKLKNTQAVLRGEISLEPKCAKTLVSELTLISAKLRDRQGRDLLDGQGRQLQVKAKAVFTLTGMHNSYSFNGNLEISVSDEERRKMTNLLGRDWADLPSIFFLKSAVAEFPKEPEPQKIVSSSHFDLEFPKLTVPEKDGGSGLMLVVEPARFKITRNPDSLSELIWRQVLTIHVGRGWSKHRRIDDFINCLEFDYDFSN